MLHKTAMLTLNGKIPDYHLLHRLADRGTYHLCTDGAYHTLKKAGITPDAVIGDMDSVGKEPEDCQVIREQDQNRNDFEKALQWLLQEGFTHVHISGFPGGRLDHELVNFTLLYCYSNKLNLYAYEGGQVARILRSGRYTFSGKKGDIFSLIALSPVKKLTLKGADYPLESVELQPGSRGLSNHFSEPEVRLFFSEGRLIVITPYESII